MTGEYCSACPIGTKAARVVTIIIVYKDFFLSTLNSYPHITPSDLMAVDGPPWTWEHRPPSSKFSRIQSRRKYETRLHQPLFARSRGAGKDGDAFRRYIVSDRGNSDSFWAAPARSEGSKGQLYSCGIA